MADTELKKKMVDYLRQTPLVQWHASREGEDFHTVSARASSKGLTLMPPQAINNDRYTLLRRGVLVKEARLYQLSSYLLRDNI